MQHSSMVLFCDECGLANDPAATRCSACQHPLARSTSNPGTPAPVTPVTITPAPVLEVTPGSLFTETGQHSLVETLLPYGNADLSGDFPPGTLLAGHYKIEKEIGRGGFSVVYRAVDLNARRHEVAIKRIQLSKLNSRQIIDATETFNRELTTLMRFKGMSGVPAFYEHLTDAENWYLIMQYIPGQTLENYLQKKAGGYLSEQETIRLGLGIARLMQTLHQVMPPVIFRDLKPANIMLTSKYEFYLIDFGIARNYTPGKARDTTPLGSPGYAPPEQYGRAQTDQRSDVYSLGATLQTLLTGRDPLDLRAGEPSRNPSPPSRALRKLLDDMLAPDMLKRPWNMTRVVARLERIQNEKQMRRSYWLGLATGALLGLFLVGVILFPGQVGGLAFVGLMFAHSILQFVKKKLGIRKAASNYWWPGFLTALLPVLIFWLVHSL